MERQVESTMGNWPYYVVSISYCLIYCVILAAVSSISKELCAEFAPTSEARKNRSKTLLCQLFFSHLTIAEAQHIFCIFYHRAL